MTRTTTTLLGFLAVTLALAGCSDNHTREPGTDAGPLVVSDAALPLADAPPASPDAPLELPDAPPVTLGTRLATCLAAGRGLEEIAVVNNNDTTDHGGLLRFGLSPDGLLAAAAADGTLKLWTLDAELLETFNGAILTYGPEIPAAPIADIAFDGETVVVGDIRGIVLQFMRDGSLIPMGGTTPEIPIRAVAFDSASRRLAHAQNGDVAPLVVRAEDGTTIDVATGILVSDLAFLPSGVLLLAGERGGHPTIEARDAAMAVVGEDITLDVDGSFVEIAYTPALGESAARLAGVATSHVLVAGETLPFAGGRSIALATDEVSAFALVAGERGLSVLDAVGAPGREVFALSGDSVTVRVDATGTIAVLGGSDALLHVLACPE